MVIKLLWQCYINMHPLAVRERLTWWSEPLSFLVCLHQLQGNCHRFICISSSIEGKPRQSNTSFNERPLCWFPVFTFVSALSWLLVMIMIFQSLCLRYCSPEIWIWLAHEWEPSVTYFHLTVQFWVLHNACFTRLVTSCFYFCNLWVKGNSLY